MSATTGIEWTDATWNPVTGCTKVSPGCDHCYAETFAERFRGVPGHHFERGFDVQLRPDKLNQPLRWRKPRKIFVNSMSDLSGGVENDQDGARSHFASSGGVFLSQGSAQHLSRTALNPSGGVLDDALIDPASENPLCQDQVRQDWILKCCPEGERGVRPRSEFDQRAGA